MNMFGPARSRWLVASMLAAGLFLIGIEARPCQAQVYGYEDTLIAPGLPPTDKAAHFGLSALGTASTLKLLQYFSPVKRISPPMRIMTSTLWLLIGFLKEMDDTRKRGTEFDITDMAANAGGVIYGNILMIEF